MRIAEIGDYSYNYYLNDNNVIDLKLTNVSNIEKIKKEES